MIFIGIITIPACLVSLEVLNATATLEVLDSFPRSRKKLYWVFFYKILSSSSEACPLLHGTKSTGELWVYVYWYTSAQAFGEYRRDGMLFLTRQMVLEIRYIVTKKLK